MAVMSDEERRRTTAHLMRNWPRTLGPLPGLKSDARAVVNAIDDWIDANQASLNSALPQPFRGAASLDGKTFAFCLVAERRANRLRTEED